MGFGFRAFLFSFVSAASLSAHAQHDPEEQDAPHASQTKRPPKEPQYDTLEYNRYLMKANFQSAHCTTENTVCGTERVRRDPKTGKTIAFCANSLADGRHKFPPQSNVDNMIRLVRRACERQAGGSVLKVSFFPCNHEGGFRVESQCSEPFPAEFKTLLSAPGGAQMYAQMPVRKAFKSPFGEVHNDHWKDAVLWSIDHPEGSPMPQSIAHATMADGAANLMFGEATGGDAGAHEGDGGNSSEFANNTVRSTSTEQQQDSHVEGLR